jgi:peptidyl-prolyl cis-trans isomerase B (cyclophilin B)
VPSEKRVRQRAAREARLAAEAKAKKRRVLFRNVAIVVVILGLIIGITVLVSGSSGKSKSKSASGTTTTVAKSADAKAQAAANAIAVKAGCPASPKTTVNTQKYPAAPAMTIDTNKLYSATVVTTAGTFDMALYAKSDPITTNNFIFLAQKGFYHCVIFHRVIPKEFVQTGDPTGLGTGGPGYTIPDELPATASNPADQYPLGSVAMGNTGQAHTGGSQWFIVAGPAGESLAPNYSLFGRIITGMDVVDTIGNDGNPNPSANGVPPDVIQRIISITIHEASGS